MVGWQGNEDFDKAVDGADLPCGCNLLREAENCLDKVEKGIKLELAKECQEKWKCPFLTGELPKDSAHLPPEAQDMIKALSTLTGTDGKNYCTCPQFYMKLPEVHRIVNAYNWQQVGELRILEGDEPSNLIVDGITAFQQGLNAKQIHENTMWKKKMEKKEE